MSTEVQDPKETVRALIEKASLGLDNPMMVAIAEMAPSPHAADHYVVGALRWPNEVGRVVRDMTRLRGRVSDGTWKELIDSNMRPADSLFGFHSDENMFSGFSFETFFIWAGETAGRSDWPLFLREIHLSEPANPVTVTTYDGAGDAPIERVTYLNLENPSFIPSGSFYRHPMGKLEFRALVTAGQPTHWSLRFPHICNDRSFAVEGKSVLLLPKPPMIFPEFWKIIKIEKKWRADSRDEIIVAVRRDNCQHGSGKLIYRRCIQMEGIWQAVLDVSYFIDDSLGLVFGTKKDPISIYCPTGTIREKAVGLSPRTTGLVTEGLAEVLLKILHPPNLRKILGRELVENPPETLKELLIRK